MRLAPWSRYGITQCIGEASRTVVPQDQMDLGTADLAGVAISLKVPIAPVLRV